MKKIEKNIKKEGFIVKATKLIRNYYDANALIHKGNKCVGIDRDKRNNKYLVFFFEQTEKLLKDIDDITILRQQSNISDLTYDI